MNKRTTAMFNLLLQMTFLGLPNTFINVAHTLDGDLFVYIEHHIADNLLYTKNVIHTFARLYSKISTTTGYLDRGRSNTSRISDKGYPPFRNVFITETLREKVRDPRLDNLKLQVQSSFWFHIIFRIFQMDPDERNKEECRRIGMNIIYIYNNERIQFVKCSRLPPWKQVKSTEGICQI